LSFLILFHPIDCRFARNGNSFGSFEIWEFGLVSGSDILCLLPAESGQIGTGRQFNAYLVAVTILVIVLGQFSPQGGCCNTHDRIRIIVVVGPTTEDLNSEGPLLRRPFATLAERFIDDVAEKSSETRALVKECVLQYPFHLHFDFVTVLFRRIST
jgi:hypothetical protein